MHLSAALFNQMSGAGIVEVPYKGSGPAALDVLAGQVQLAIVDLPSALPHIAAGKVVAYAVTSPQRLPMLPNVPTVAEAGLAGYDSTGWFGVVAPAATPTPIVTRLNAEINAALNDEAIKASMPQARRRAGARHARGVRGLHPLGNAEVGEGDQEPPTSSSIEAGATVFAMRDEEADVVVVGAGPVGLTLAIDLAGRGVQGDRRRDARYAEPPSVKCNHVAARIDGAVPPARHRREGAQCRLARGLPERRRVPDHGDRHRADADPDPVPRRTLHVEGGSRHRLADARAAAPDQPALLRADPAGACGVAAGHPLAPSHPGRRLRADRRRRRARCGRGRCHRSRQRRATASCARATWSAATAAARRCASRSARAWKARR